MCGTRIMILAIIITTKVDRISPQSIDLIIDINYGCQSEEVSLFDAFILCTHAYV